MENSNSRLRELKGSDFKIVDEQPDIKGWSLYDGEHQKVGEVEDLLFDVELRKVRYIIADLDDNELGLDEKEVLIPIGIAELHESDDEVILPGVTATQLSALPEYDGDHDLSEADEQSVLAAFSGVDTSTVPTLAGGNADRYSHEHFDDQRLYRNRNQQSSAVSNDANVLPVFEDEVNFDRQEVESGRIRLHSRIVQESLEEEINLGSEEGVIERRGADGTANSDEFRETESDKDRDAQNSRL